MKKGGTPFDPMGNHERGIVAGSELQLSPER
jgi:hypothetical protein